MTKETVATDAALLSATERRARTVDGRGLADIRLLKVEDGPGRGQRLLSIRNATGVGFEIAIDRGFDLASATWRGINIGWNSANGLPWPTHPLDAEGGIGFYRNLDGFLFTCGLDHIGGAKRTTGEHFIHKHRREVFHPLHGRISSQRAMLGGYGITWGDQNPTIWAEAVLRQSAVFGEHLVLHRRIELPVFGNRIRISDKVENAGFRPTPHSILYHVNFGFPFLDEVTSLQGDIDPVACATFNAGTKTPDPDFVDFYEAVEVRSHSQLASVEVRNEALLGGIAVVIEYPKDLLPKLGVWRAFQSGVYTMAVEPSQPANVAGEAGEVPSILQAGQIAEYEVSVTIGG